MCGMCMKRTAKLVCKFWFYTITLMFFWVGVKQNDQCYFTVVTHALTFIAWMNFFVEQKEEGELL